MNNYKYQPINYKSIHLHSIKTKDNELHNLGIFYSLKWGN